MGWIPFQMPSRRETRKGKGLGSLGHARRNPPIGRRGNGYFDDNRFVEPVFAHNRSMLETVADEERVT